MSDAGTMSFKTFCDLCSDIKNAKPERKALILEDFIDDWRGDVFTENMANPNSVNTFYPVFRFLLPQLDRERGAYGVKENTLAKIYIRILCLPKDGNDAMKLLEYRNPKYGGRQSSDFAEVAHWILRTRCSRGEGLCVNEINDHLDAIAAKHSSNDSGGVESELITLLKETSAYEQKWLIRIILKDMRLGLGQNKILDCYHRDAKEYFDSCNDLKKVCDILIDRFIRLNEVGIEVFSPCKPMLAEECDVGKVDNYLKRSQCFFVETKLDGERFQLHMNNGEYKYFSRNGIDYTANFGKSRQEGTLTPKLANKIRANVECVILDGEMMCWDLETNSFLTKGMNMDVKYLKEGGRYQPCFCAFDILYLDNRVLTNECLNDRVKLLKEVVTPEVGVITVVDRKIVSTKEEVWEALNNAIENKEEGIVMKDFLSVYKPNVRNNGGWYKLKPEYAEGLMDCLDVLIIGGYYGSGRHRGNISHFLLGVATESPLAPGQKIFLSVARVGSGYSLEELQELQEKLKPFWNEVKPGQMPNQIEWGREKPDLWIEPCNSFILEIKASEIMPSDSFKTGYTLRFPRVEKVRYDKSWTDCLTWNEFEDKRRATSGKLVKRPFQGGDTEEDVSPKKKIPRSDFTVPEQFRPADLSQVQIHTNLLKGKEICVFSGCDGYTKAEVEVKVAENGGTLVQNPGANTYCVLAEEESSVRISNVIKCQSHNVMRTSFFIAQLISGTAPELAPEVLLGASNETSEKFSATYDEYGDHFTQFATRQSIQHPFRVIESKAGNQRPNMEDILQLDRELFRGPSPFSLFRNKIAYFDNFSVVEDVGSTKLHHLETSQISFRFHGGVCTDEINESTTHVVMSLTDLTRLEQFQRQKREKAWKFYLVTEDWIKQSLSAEKLLSERHFYPKFWI